MGKSVNGGALALVMLAAIAVAPVAQANGPVVGRSAGGIAPLRTDEVQLVSERVFVHLGDMEATCTYELRNLSDSTRSLQMSFVVEDERSYERYRDAFEVTVNRRDVPVHLEKTDVPQWAGFVRAVPESLPVWEVVIPAKGVTKVHIKYGVAWGGGADGHHVYREFTYYAKSASLWAGEIEEASISFLFPSLEAELLQCSPECVGLKAEPADWSWRGQTIHWTRANWEPEEDFQVALDWLEGDEQ